MWPKPKSTSENGSLRFGSIFCSRLDRRRKCHQKITFPNDIRHTVDHLIPCVSIEMLRSDIIWGRKPAFFPLSEAIKFSWWSLGALSLREYTFISKSFQSSQIVFERNVPWSVMSYAMLCLWQTHAGADIVGKGYCTCLCVQCIGCDMLFCFILISFLQQIQNLWKKHDVLFMFATNLNTNWKVSMFLCSACISSLQTSLP